MDDAGNAAPGPEQRNIGNILASERTTLAFQRTRFASDRTLMATVRTSLSMIGFGFTIYSFFRAISETELLYGRLPQRTPAVLGMALITLGVILLATAIWADIRFRRNLNDRQAELTTDHLLPPVRAFPPSLAVLGAILLLLIGLSAMLAVVLRL